MLHQISVRLPPVLSSWFEAHNERGVRIRSQITEAECEEQPASSSAASPRLPQSFRLVFLSRPLPELFPWRCGRTRRPEFRAACCLGSAVPLLGLLLSRLLLFRCYLGVASSISGGSFFLFDQKVLRYFRKDDHNWRKKKMENS